MKKIILSVFLLSNFIFAEIPDVRAERFLQEAAKVEASKEPESSYLTVQSAAVAAGVVAAALGFIWHRGVQEQAKYNQVHQ